MPVSAPSPIRATPASGAISTTSGPPPPRRRWRRCSSPRSRRPASATTPSTSIIPTSGIMCSRSRRRCERNISRSTRPVSFCRSTTPCSRTCTTIPQRYREWAELRIEALNHALEGIPEDQVRYHVCFGSWHVPHVADAPLDALIDLILQVRAGAYSIEAANPRHEHEWRVWEQARLPAGKILIPGVITHHITTVEHPRLIADRIVRFATIVGRENVIAGTDCGFAQSQGTQRVHPTIMWAKFEALAEGARLASEDLWGRSIPSASADRSNLRSNVANGPRRHSLTPG